MDVIAWIVSGLLALAMLGAGGMKLARSRQDLKASGQMDWVDDFSAPMIKLIGGLEVAAAVGLILPWALDVVRVLTPLAAVGVALLMVGAMVTHTRRGEQKALPANAVLLVLALFVAIVRLAA